jgi:hypothetical protein
MPRKASLMAVNFCGFVAAIPGGRQATAAAQNDLAA